MTGESKKLSLPRPAWGASVLVLVVLLSLTALALGAHEPWFLGIGKRGAQGADFFCVPKAFLNLWDGRSAFDTWSSPTYGPFSTWFVLHPAVALWLGGPLAWLPPWWSYGAFVLITLAVLGGCAHLIARNTPGPWRQVLVWGAFVASPVSYWLLFTGNIHGFVVLAVTLVLVGLHEASEPCPRPFRISPSAKIGTGVLLSLLTKPVLLLLTPALLFVPSTRRPTGLALLIYAAISLLFLLMPMLNPQSMGWARSFEVATDPQWVRANLNIYENHFQLVPEMRDNAMHWLHMVAQSGYSWEHAQLYSLPVTWKAWGDAPSALRHLVLLPSLLALPLLWVREKARQLKALGWLLALTLALHFMAYAVAWEYQYTQLLPILGALLALGWDRRALRTPAWVALAALSTLWLPTPYALLSADGLSVSELTAMRLWRVAPAFVVSIIATSAVLELTFFPKTT